MTGPTYKDALVQGNIALAANDRTRFIGYGLMKGRALGTLKGVAANQIIETPVAENLMVGLAIGLALKGYRPVVFIERMDFILNALDAIVNHLDKAKPLSRGEFSPAVVIRTVVGNKEKPLYTGITHTQDFAEAVRHMVSFPVFQLKTPAEVTTAYQQAESNLVTGISTILVEYKDLV
jgi:pyruvate/2-oxoglutarate/acetoin dehydrogenase E1 component